MTRNRRATTALVTAEAPTASPAEPGLILSPEEQIATETLAGIPEVLITDELRATVLRGAQIEAKRREFATATSQALSDVQEAIANGDVAAATAASVDLVALERLEGMLPVPTIQESLLNPAFAKAGDMIAGAVGTLPLRPPYLAYSLELAAWRSLGPINLQTTDPPVLLAGERTAVQEIDRYIAARARQVETLRAWRADVGAGDPFSHLGAVGAHVENCRLLIVEYDRVTNIVTELNDKRVRGHFSWTPPPQAATPEVRLMLDNRNLPALTTKGN